MSLAILDNALGQVFEYGNPESNKKFIFIDLFTEIGGFHIALSALGGKCVFAAEIDEHTRKIYKDNLIKKKFKIKQEPY
jgi:site-specific DNA-cytosine methylase